MDWLRELRQAARALRRAPTFAVVVVITLALGIGANVAIYSVVRAVLLRGLPFAEAGRIAVVWESRTDRGENYMFASPPNFADWRERSRELAQIAAFAPREFFLAAPDETMRVAGARVSAELFPLLGVAPAVGRGFARDDDVPGAARVVILGDGLWRSRFGADRGILGRAVELDDGTYTVVGVMPPDFTFPPAIDLEGRTFPRRTELWVPFALDPAAANRGAHYMTVLGRLRDGTDFPRAEAELRAIAARMVEEQPETNTGWTVRLVPLERAVVGDLRSALLVLLGAVGAVLLVACVNVANLLLVRALGRQREMAIRAALGAGPWALVRPVLAESQLLAVAGGVAGLALAVVVLPFLISLAPSDIPRLEEVRVDATVAGYAIALSVLTGVLFGLIPAVRAWSPRLTSMIESGGRAGSSGGEQSRLRAGLVVTEVALSLVLLVGAGLLFRSFLALRALDTGVVAEHVLTLRTSLAATRYPDVSRVRSTYAEIERAVASLPEVQAAGLSLDIPLAGDYQGTGLVIDGDPLPGPGELRPTHFSIVTPGYFGAIGIPIRRGRGLVEGDVAEAPPVLVVNETLAAMYFGGREPIGRSVSFGGVSRQIVGIVGDARLETLRADPTPAMYFPHAQVPATRGMSLVVRTRGDPTAIHSAVRERIRAVDTAIPVFDVRTMEEIVAGTLAQPRFAATMLFAFSLLALGLAAVGIYGVVSYAVSQQSREIGIRLALGAGPADELQRIVGRGGKLVALGVVVGVAAALMGRQLIAGLLYGVTTTDPAVLGATAVALLGVGGLACLVPAVRASRTDPIVVLREE
ncbi:MAG TPA: ABC transporter permease [Gemmatimonadaceae bacterium]|nr:ABC transporter permease [Gemmatimonadaceae bacterium]